MGRYRWAVAIAGLETVDPFPPAPTPVEFAQQIRKLMAVHLMPATNIAGGKISVGLLTSLVALALIFGTGLVGICILGWLWFRRSSRHAETAVQYNDQGIVDSLTEQNSRMLWASRRPREAALYLVHVQDIAGIGLPRTVVVKKFQNANRVVDDNLESRCRSEMILLAGNIRHDNIINVVHYIRRDDAIMLVYEYVENGSLDNWLHRLPLAEGGRSLSWPTRQTIAMGVAEGLCYMHHGCNNPIVHHNINSNNILLDRNFKAKIASFGVAQINVAGLGQPLPIAERPAGNFGYAAPEYGTRASELTEKVDVYSFGVVLLELVTGRVATSEADGQLATWARNNCEELMKNRLEGFKNAVDMGILQPDRARYLKEMAAVFRLGVDCTVRDPPGRPSMHTVLRRLRRRGRGRFGGLLTCYQL